jgi:hypothetical protein
VNTPAELARASVNTERPADEHYNVVGIAKGRQHYAIHQIQ